MAKIALAAGEDLTGQLGTRTVSRANWVLNIGSDGGATGHLWSSASQPANRQIWQHQYESGIKQENKFSS